MTANGRSIDLGSSSWRRAVHSRQRGAPSIFASICSRKMPDGKFDLTVGKLSPLLNDWQ